MLIKYIKSVLWRVAKRLSYTEDARCLKVKYLHHPKNTEDIKQELFELGYNVPNMINAQHKTTKKPLNLFFVVLEAAKN